MLDVTNSYNEKELLTVLFNVQKFENTIKHSLYSNFNNEEIHLIAEYYINNNLLTKAIKVLTLGVDLYPFDTDLYIKKADVLITLLKSNSSKIAITEIAEILTRLEIYAPNDCRVYVLWSEYYSIIGNGTEKSISILKKALKVTDNKDIICLNIANNYFKEGNYNKAIYYLKDALRYNPDSKETPIILQEIYLHINQAGQARSFLEHFITKLNPYSFSSWFALGYNYASLKEYDKAIVCYDYALAINNNYFEATLYKIGSLIKINNNCEAIELLRSIEDYIHVLDNFDLAIIASYYNDLNYIKKARSYYKKILSNDKNNSVALFGMSLTYLGYSPKNALKYIKQACKIEPNNTTYLSVLANIQSEVGDIVEAYNTYNNLISQDPINSNIWVEYLEFLFDNGNTYPTNMICDVAKQALRYNNNCSKIYYILARILFIDKQYNHAETYLRTAVAIDSSTINIFIEKIPKNIIKDETTNAILTNMIKSATDHYLKTI